MNHDAYEPYEVTVSNSQMAAFAALLALALVGAFAAGVWWGRSNDLDLPETRAAVALADLPPAETAAGAVSAAGKSEVEAAPVEVVRFFGGAGERRPAVGGDGPTSAATAAGLVVQVFSSADVEQAASVERKLQADGHRAFLSPQTLDGQVMQRVRVGPFEDQNSASEAADLLARQYGLETWITPNN